MAAAILSESAPRAGHKISVFFQSLLLLLADALRQVLALFPTSGRRNRRPSKSEPGITASPPRSAVTMAHPTSSSGPSAEGDNTRHTAYRLSDVRPAFPRARLINNGESTMSGSRGTASQLATEFAAVSLDGPDRPQHRLADKTPRPNVRLPPGVATSAVAAGKRAVDVAGLATGRGGQEHRREEAEVSSASSAHAINGFAGSVPSNVQCKFDFAAKTEEEIRVHGGFMEQALDMARLALKTNETPVGCVLVHNGRIVAKGMNATNVTRNGTRHAELMAISALVSYPPASDLGGLSARGGPGASHSDAGGRAEAQWGDVDPADGHLFPYGQKLHPSPRVSRAIISECVLYVTVEPCIMCASLLRQLRIRKVYFGAVNDKFGGTGGVLHIHKNYPAIRRIASAPGSPVLLAGTHALRPTLDPRAASSVETGADSTSSLRGLHGAVHMGRDDGAEPLALHLGPLDDGGRGDGGNVEAGYDVEGGWGRDAAVTLLRQFYVQENGRAPAPRKKEGRAARLAAMMERDGHAGGPMSEAPVVALPPAI